MGGNNLIHEVHLLILGSPRSGTTLLSAMLSCHPDISILSEDLNGSSFKILSKRVKGVKLCIPHQIEIEHTKYRKIKDLNFARIKFWVKSKSALSIRDYEKRANNLHILGIIRDPDSVVKSIMKRGSKSRQVAEYRWQRAIEILYQLSKERHRNEDFTVIDFDTLVMKPSSTMQKILLRLGSDFDEIVLEGYKHTPQYKEHNRINNKKASKGIKNALNYPLLQKDKELKEKYIYLTEKARILSNCEPARRRK